MKADLNITKGSSTEPSINIVTIESWNPIKDFKYQSFVYDTAQHKPYLNIDSDGAGTPDINIDVDGDFIPDIDIDSDGDGIPDVNVDTDGDGKADENIIEIKEWKPNKDVDGDVPYDTMDFSKPEKPSDPKTEKPDTSVMGQYNPVTSIGGANTGDTTNLIFYADFSLITFGILLYMANKRKTDA